MAQFKESIYEIIHIYERYGCFRLEIYELDIYHMERNKKAINNIY